MTFHHKIADFDAWRDDFIQKALKIIKRENIKTIEDIPAFFLYDNMRIYDAAFCPLYERNEKCHIGIADEKFCCLFCGCPFFDSKYRNDDRHEYGACTNNIGRGVRNSNGYWDCTDCAIVHDIDWILQNKVYIVGLFGEIISNE